MASTKRSNKTARVLNLISNPQDADGAEIENTEAEVAAEAAEAQTEAPEQAAPAAEPEAAAPEAAEAPAAAAQPETAAAPAAESTPPPPPATPVAPIIQDIHEKEQVLTDAIASGLMTELEATAEPEPAPAPESAPAAASAEVTASAEEQHKPSAGNIVYVPPTSGNSASDVQLPGKNALHTPSGVRDVEYVNILQELVDEQCQYYIQNMMNCTCSRCIADMKALALTNLPAKYVVLSKPQKNAFMSVYAARYEKLLSVQLMRSCVVINESPHH